MSGYLRNSTLKLTIKCAKILGRSPMGDNRINTTVGNGFKGYPHGALTCVRHKSSRQRDRGGKREVSSILKPVLIKPHVTPDGSNPGAELTGKELSKDDITKTMNKFYRSKQVKDIALNSGIDDKMFFESFVSFRRYCVESESLPVELHVVLSDMIQGADHVDSIVPFYLEHAKQMYPHLDCMEDLALISDLTVPANWYPEARQIKRKIVYHAGPTNSGKTYHALKRLKEAKSGVYCGPLRMLANEVFQKMNDQGTVCDLITGEERRHLSPDGEPASHVACTVEMTSTTTPYEVAVIDEIQLLRDPGRSWAWTRALLGVCAEEVHVCGEVSAIDFVKELVEGFGDEFTSHSYERLTSLEVMHKGIDDLKNVEPGDCIVCFNKSDIYRVSRELENHGIEVAVIYGGLPPATKVSMANKFNDPENSCNVLVATDAVGMGLNLNIRRMIFYSLTKFVNTGEGGMKRMEIEPSQALQIAGRAGRYGTKHLDGQVTTFRTRDLPVLTRLLQTPIAPVEQAGLHPSYNEIELFSYQLPDATLCNIIELFATMCKLDDDRYFLCQMDEFKFLAETIEHVPMDLKDRYVFCCAPIPRQVPFVATLFLKFARKFSRGEPITIEYLERVISWPYNPPKVITDLSQLEAVFDVLDAYRWLSFRFPEIFAFPEEVEDMQVELNVMIEQGVQRINALLKNADNQQIYQQVETAEEKEDEERVMSMMEKSNRPQGRSRLRKKQETDIKRQIVTSLFDKGIVTRESLEEKGINPDDVLPEIKPVHEVLSNDVLLNPKWDLTAGYQSNGDYNRYQSDDAGTSGGEVTNSRGTSNWRDLTSWRPDNPNKAPESGNGSLKRRKNRETYNSASFDELQVELNSAEKRLNQMQKDLKLTIALLRQKKMLRKLRKCAQEEEILKKSLANLNKELVSLDAEIEDPNNGAVAEEVKTYREWEGSEHNRDCKDTSEPTSASAEESEKESARIKFVTQFLTAKTGTDSEDQSASSSSSQAAKDVS